METKATTTAVLVFQDTEIMKLDLDMYPALRPFIQERDGDMLTTWMLIERTGWHGIPETVIRLLLAHVLCETPQTSSPTDSMENVYISHVQILVSMPVVSWLEQHTDEAALNRLAALWRRIMNNQPDLNLFTILEHHPRWNLRALARLDKGSLMLLPPQAAATDSKQVVPTWFCPDLTKMSFAIFSMCAGAGVDMRDMGPTNMVREHGRNLLCLIQQYLQQCESLGSQGSLDPRLWHFDNQGLWKELYGKMRVSVLPRKQEEQEEDDGKHKAVAAATTTTTVIDQVFDLEKLKSGAFAAIKKVHLVNRKDTGVVLQYLAAHCPAVEDLYIGYCFDNAKSDMWTRALSTMSPTLTKLAFYNCHPFTDATLLDVGRTTSLQHLKITFLNQVTNTGIAHLGNLTSLQHLSLMDGKRITSVSCLKNMPLLKNVLLSLRNLDNDDALVVLGQAARLETLWLGTAFGMSLDALRHFANPSSVLRELTVVDATGMWHIDMRHLSRIPSLRKLNLHNLRLDSFKQGSLGNQLVSLNLDESELPADMDLTGMDKLVNVQLHLVRNLTLDIVRQCATLPNLETLDLSANNGFSSVVFDILASAPRLRELTLSHCNGIKSFGAFQTQFKSLEMLDLFGCGMNTAPCVEGALRFQSIRRLRVHEDGTLTDAVHAVATAGRLVLITD